jgi:protein TonB
MKLYQSIKTFNRYFVASLAIHVLILFMMQDYFATPPTETYQDLEVEIQPLEEKKKSPRPLVEKKKKIKEKKITPRPKPLKKIPREVELPPRPLDDKAKFSMYKDGSGIRGKPQKRPPRKKVSPVTTTRKQATKRQIIIKPGKKTAPPEKEPAKTTLPEKNKERLRPFSTEDMFVRKPPSEAPPVKTEKKSKLPDQIIANLDEYINADKFDKSELFGDSMLTFNDENFRYVWYGRVVKKKVVDGWYPPIAAKLGLTGKAVVTFNILKNGSIKHIKLKESTGNKSLDRASLNAIKSATPFPDLPEDYEYDQLGVVFSFWYNLSRPGS